MLNGLMTLDFMVKIKLLLTKIISCLICSIRHFIFESLGICSSIDLEGQGQGQDKSSLLILDLTAN